jgi:hypothetical protein
MLLLIERTMNDEIIYRNMDADHKVFRVYKYNYGHDICGLLCHHHTTYDNDSKNSISDKFYFHMCKYI